MASMFCSKFLQVLQNMGERLAKINNRELQPRLRKCGLIHARPRKLVQIVNDFSYTVDPLLSSF